MRTASAPVATLIATVEPNGSVFRNGFLEGGENFSADPSGTMIRTSLSIGRITFEARLVYKLPWAPERGVEGQAVHVSALRCGERDYAIICGKRRVC